MNKQEIAIVVLLFGALIGWSFLNKDTFTKPPVAPVENASDGSATNAVPSDSSTPASDGGTSSVVTEEAVPDATQPVEPEVKKGLLPENRVSVENDVIRLTVSSWGAGVVEAVLKDYDEANDPESGPVVLDFSSHPALMLTGIPGLDLASDFEISHSSEGTGLLISRKVSDTLFFERKIMLGDGYKVDVSDMFKNIGGEYLDIPEVSLGLGPMHKVETKGTARRGVVNLGADTFSSLSGRDVVHWAKKGDGESDEDAASLVSRFQPVERQGGCAMFKPKLKAPLSHSVEVVRNNPVTDSSDWVAVKNKFFVQIMAGEQEDDSVGYSIQAFREVDELEKADNPASWSAAVKLESVSAGMIFSGQKSLAPGEIVTRDVSYFVGPKKYSVLKTLGKHQDKVMFGAWPYCGWFRSLCVLLLWILNAIYAIIPNYGVAVILLTIIVRLVFWPIMQKSTDSMKKMQTIQPLVKEIKEKYKDNPQRVQKETMALYKVHKVNPMASCLPMVVQMPIFIALFVMLRSAVELRFADFLWISDLSEPEGLLAGTAFFNAIPLISCLNILPILMTVTMIWQQKLTPSSGDAQQKQMMMMMPIMMLVMFYNMASALVLYWTTSQTLAIVQLLLKKDKNKSAEAKA